MIKIKNENIDEINFDLNEKRKTHNKPSNFDLFNAEEL